MAFSASESAFEGFRIIRREPILLAVWGGVQLLFSVAITVISLPVMRSVAVKVELPPVSGGAANPAAAHLAAMSGAGWIYLVLVPVYLLLFSVLGAAVYRTVLRPDDNSLGRLKFGPDELRLTGLWVLIGLVYFGAMLGILLVLGALFAGAAIAGRGSTGATVVVALVSLALYLGFFLSYCWVAVRLSLAGPMTFAKGRISLFSSWKLTKGHFWPLFGCYLLAAVFAILIGLVELAIIGALNLGASGGSFTAAATAMTRPDVRSYASYFSIARIVGLVIGAPFAGLFWAVLMAPAAVAYREIAGPRPEDQAEAFA
jgi:hypothetical protein